MRNRFSFALAFSFLLAMGTSGLLAQTTAPGPDENPTANTGALKAQIETGGSYDAHSGNATRIIPDLHVPGALGVYGLDFIRYYNSLRNDRDQNFYLSPAPIPDQPTDFGSPGWSHSWSWSAGYEQYLQEIGGDQGQQVYTMSITITFPDGHASKYTITRSNQWAYGQTWSPDPRFGPPYYAEHGEVSWPPSGEIHDYLDNMAQDGSEFWLHRADGGSVHFQNSAWGYQARQVFDPHGLLTTLSYDENGHLYRVEQDGGRWLSLTWSGSVISRVETGGYAGSQAVDYCYSSLGGWPILIQAHYHNDPVQDQTTSASYTYQTYVAPTGFFYTGPLLVAAYDPRFAGPMKSINYNYRGSGCTTTEKPAPGFEPYQDAQFDYFYASPTAIAAEKSGATGTIVSSFTLGCFDGTRTEYNGLGGLRKFFFGRSAGAQGSYHALGFQLAKLTDYTNVYPLPSNLPFERQNYLNAEPRQIWDARGILTEVVYADGSGFPIEVRHVGSDGSVYYYDRLNPGSSDPQDFSRIHNPYAHWLFSKTDERNQPTIYTRDSRRRVKRIDYFGGSYETFDYDPLTNQVTSHRLPSGAAEFYQYDPTTHRLMIEYNSEDGWDARKEYTYGDPNHPGLYDDLVHTMQDGRARAAGAAYSVLMLYNGRNRVTEVHYAPTGLSSDPHVSYQYDEMGNCRYITDEMGHTSEYQYDDYGRCIYYIEPINAPDWNGTGNVTSRRWDWIYDRWINGLGQFSASAHTKNEWRIQIEPAFNAAGERRMTARAHDLQNRIVIEQTGWIQPPGPIPYDNPNWYQSGDIETHYFGYDANGNKNSYTDPLQRLTTYDYDLRNRLWKTNETVNTLPRTTEVLYDVTGNKTDVTFPDTTSQHWRDYDAFGQAWTFIDERNNTTNLSFIWGPMKKLYTVTTHRDRDGGGTEDQMTVTSYDGMGRPQTTLFPDSSNEYSTYEFGQLKTWKTRKNQTKRIHYDARGREDYHTWDDGAAPRIDRAWDDASRLTSISNIFSTIDYDYDAAGQAKYEGNTIAGSGGRVQTTFYRYGNGELANLVYPAGPWVRHDYNARGQLQTAGVADGSGNWAFQLINYHYLQDGKVEHQDYGNGTTSTFTYDGRGFMNFVRHAVGNQELAKRTYWRDGRDRITGMQKGSGNAVNGMEDGRGNGYSYDPEGELYYVAYGATIDGNGNASNPIAGEDYFQYDALGNRHAFGLVHSHGWTEYTRRDNGLNQYAGWSPNPVVYDDTFYGVQGNGVTMQEGWITASYNALNQPIAIWSPAYNGTPNFMWFGYDPLGRCVKRWVSPASDNYSNATYMYYDGWSLIQEGTGAWSPTRLYVQGNRIDEMAVTFNVVAGQYGFHHYDVRGDAILLTNLSGGIMEQYYIDAFGVPFFYDAWGNWVGGQSNFGNRFLFTGREWLQDLHLYDFRNRMYQPELGRFLQPDPKEFAAGDYNLYRYCHNDPINKSDPLGLLEITLEEYKRIPFSNLKELVQTKFEVFYSLVDAGKAGGKAAGPAALADHAERYGGVGRVSNTRFYIYGHPIKGTHDKVQNYSALRTAPLPNGVERVGGYWVLGRHQNANSWPVNRFNGKSDGQVLRESHFSAVMTNPPSPGANSLNNQYSYKSYEADSDKEGN